MIKHIVMWKLQEEANGNTKAENAEKFKLMLEELVPEISELITLEVGIGYNEADGAVFDMVLTTTHDSKEGLKAYATHPKHLKVVDFAKTIVAERRVVDYVV